MNNSKDDIVENGITYKYTSYDRLHFDEDLLRYSKDRDFSIEVEKIISNNAIFNSQFKFNDNKLLCLYNTIYTQSHGTYDSSNATFHSTIYPGFSLCYIYFKNHMELEEEYITMLIVNITPTYFKNLKYIEYSPENCHYLPDQEKAKCKYVKHEFFSEIIFYTYGREFARLIHGSCPKNGIYMALKYDIQNSELDLRIHDEYDI